ncbi:MAG: DUF4091 domain-containing protein [Planctomycetota bacterium]|jgi:hypothetical protein
MECQDSQSWLCADEKSDQDLEGREFLPGLVPDPLFDEDSIVLPKNETHAFWVSVIPARNAKTGKNIITVKVLPCNRKAETLKVEAVLSKISIPKRKNFAVTHWFYIDTLMAYYKTDMFDKKFWDILPRYMKNLSEHGQDTIYTSIFSVQLDGDRIPSQLLRVRKTGPDKYSFDWRDVKKFVTLAKKAGLKNFEWSHFFSQWGVKHALKIYEGQGETGKLLWKKNTSATSKTYRKFFEQFLPEFHSFLKKEKLLNRSFFHVSDEPGEQHLGNYKKARAMLKEIAPWMKVMDALSHTEFAEEGLTDMPVPSINTALDFYKKKIDSWCYFCCGPRGKYLNRLFDTPLAKIRMSGWLFYRWPFKGFLHWGYNYWNDHHKAELVDTFNTADANHWPGWPYGDTFLVYPGKQGPLDSIRWEVFAESLQDYALLQGAGIERDDKILQELKSFSNFPKTEKWLQKTRKKILGLI